MKRLVFFMLLFVAFIPNVLAEENESIKYPAELVKCDSLSNIWVRINEDTKRLHLLAFETESGSLDNEINNYVCSSLESANTIEIEYDIETTDRYNRDLVYLYINNKLLQNDLLTLGYGQVDNVLAEYKYLSTFCDIQKEAIIKRLGIWNYPNIEEKYCNSGIPLDGSYEEVEETNEKEEDISNTLYFMVLINFGILILILILKRNLMQNKSN